MQVDWVPKGATMALFAYLGNILIHTWPIKIKLYAAECVEGIEVVANWVCVESNEGDVA